MLKRTAAIFLLFLISFLLCSVPAAAENGHEDETVEEWMEGDRGNVDSEETLTADESNQGMAATIFKMLAALLFVLFLIYAFAKFVNKKTKPFFGNRGIEAIGGVAVGNQRSVQLVRIGEKILVIGVGESVQLLKEISDQQEVEALLQEKTDASSYEHVLSKVKQQIQLKTLKGKSNFSSILDQQLKQMTENRNKFFRNAVKKESSDE